MIGEPRVPRRPRAAFVVLLAMALMPVACNRTDSRLVTIEWSSIQQTIDGFGAASNETAFVQPLSDREMDFFYTTSGLGF